MLEHNKKNDELVLQYRELLKRAKDATSEEEKNHFNQLASKKHDEIITEEFGDPNWKRFTY